MSLLLPTAAVATCFVSLGTILYRKLRPKFNIQVNCWFCNKDTVVPYGNANCWDCPHCEQYNGFTLDGDYNKPIPAQHNGELNHPIPPVQGKTEGASNALCERCNRNQLLKVKQLANFVPFTEANFDAEVEVYERYLDDVYPLCRHCQRHVSSELGKQDEKLLHKLEEAGLDTSDVWSEADSICSSHLVCRMSTPHHIRLLRAVSIVCAGVILLANFDNLLRDSEVWRPPIPDFLTSYLLSLYASNHVLILVGLFTAVAAVYRFGQERLNMADALCSLLWLALLLLHSQLPARTLPNSDVYILQTLVAGLTTIASVWCAVCPRSWRSYTGKFTPRKNRRSLDRSFSSISGSSTVGQDRDSKMTQSFASFSAHSRAPSVNGLRNGLAAPSLTEEDGGIYLNKFYSMSLGPPSTNAKPTNVMFPSLYTPPPSPAGSVASFCSATSLRSRRPIISPARFNADEAKKRKGMPVTSSPMVSMTGKSLNQQLFSSSVSQAGSVFGDDKLSLRGWPTHRTGLKDSDPGEISDSSHSSVCPVDTTWCAMEQNKEEGKKRLATRVVLGVSVGFNVALLMYFLLDFKSYL